jgi:hypothetical protein
LIETSYEQNEDTKEDLSTLMKRGPLSSLVPEHSVVE